eukprot:SAG31_NODE_20106_length_583_cov_1.816116_1_plen_134_part_00
MIACLLLHMLDYDKAEDALRWFGYCRTSNGKGVTIPSQQRYVKYYEDILAHHNASGAGSAIGRTTAWLTLVKVHTVPHFDYDGGADLFFVIKQRIEPLKRSSKSYGLKPKHKRGLKNPDGAPWAAAAFVAVSK